MDILSKNQKAGAGKTLLGLQFCHEFKNYSDAPDALFLSGNGPLIQVLQDALGNKVFARDVHGFLRQHDQISMQTCREHVLVFDEAQRAWDAKQVFAKRKVDKSEPMSFVDIGAAKSWTVLIALIGSGQEIYKGEEAGIEQWNTAISRSPAQWKVFCPPAIATIFEGAHQIIESESLNLNKSLRSHIAIDLHAWVNALLAGELDEARSISKRVIKDGFKMYLTRDIEAGKDYLKSMYAAMETKRFGAIASSQANYLKSHKLDVSFNGRRSVHYPAWFNSPPGSGISCCDFTSVATEFECQGLELDMPLICWARDLLWNGTQWNHSGRTSVGIQDPRQLTLNAYRVLLTRGKDGFVIFLPNHTLAKTTYNILKRAGVQDIPSIAKQL
jgi:DUF2075 family protein